MRLLGVVSAGVFVGSLCVQHLLDYADRCEEYLSGDSEEGSQAFPPMGWSHLLSAMVLTIGICWILGLGAVSAVSWLSSMVS